MRSYAFARQCRTTNCLIPRLCNLCNLWTVLDSFPEAATTRCLNAHAIAGLHFAARF